MDMLTKLEVLADAAKYDAACTSSGVERAGRRGGIGTASNAGCCHSFTADGRCVSLLKVLLTNVCVYDCAYCVNRRSNDVPRAAFTPRELADLTIAFYRRNYIEGLFISSGVIRSPDYTMELVIETVRILREEKGFRGYIHAKAIPGCSEELVMRLGRLVDRMSVNVELPSQASLDYLAPEKSAVSSIAPMRLIRDGIEQSHEERSLARRRHLRRMPAAFAPAGQSTQLIVGATPETDRHILILAEQLYGKLGLKRVFFSAYVPVNDDARLPSLATQAPLTREHRLYQADWLLRYYEFTVDELLDDGQPNLSLELDPKAAWALAHMDFFPLEVNRASYEELLRVPGLGVKTAKRIVRARRAGPLDFEALERLGLSLKRAGFFITAHGRMHEGFSPDADAARSSMVASTRETGAGRKSRAGLVEGQMTLFSDACQEARDPLSTSPRDRVRAAARSARLAARCTGPAAGIGGADSSLPGASRRGRGGGPALELGSTPSGLPAADPLLPASTDAS